MTRPERRARLSLVTAAFALKPDVPEPIPFALFAGHERVARPARVTLEGVRAIAGYVLDKNGRRWIVVFFVNHANAGGAQAAQDALLQWVYERGAG